MEPPKSQNWWRSRINSRRQTPHASHNVNETTNIKYHKQSLIDTVVALLPLFELNSVEQLKNLREFQNFKKP